MQSTSQSQSTSTVEIRNEFYRDSFWRVMFIVFGFFFSLLFLLGVSFYLYLNQPRPVVFPVGKEWRTIPEIALDRPYLTLPNMLQWLANAISNVFVYDYYHYNDQLNAAQIYFTSAGWKVFLNQLNIYANYNTIQKGKMFVNATPAGAPYLLKEGVLSGRYAWWVQMPITIQTISGEGQTNSQNLTLQILVVRVSTLNNLLGVGIENIIVADRTSNPLV